MRSVPTCKNRPAEAHLSVLTIGAPAGQTWCQDSVEFIFVGPEGGSASSSRNRAAKEATGDWLLFLDADCQLGEGQLERILLLIDGGEGGRLNPDFIYGGLYARPRLAPIWAHAYNWIQRTWVTSSVREGQPQNLLGGCLLISRDRFFEVGAYDERIPWAGEETEFLRRARRAGKTLVLLDALEVEHQNALSMIGFIKRALFQGFNCGRYDLGTELSFRAGNTSPRRDRISIRELPLIALFLGLVAIARAAGFTASLIPAGMHSALSRYFQILKNALLLVPFLYWSGGPKAIAGAAGLLLALSCFAGPAKRTRHFLDRGQVLLFRTIRTVGLSVAYFFIFLFPGILRWAFRRRSPPEGSWKPTPSATNWELPF